MNVRNVLIAGSGLMGQGIAIEMARGGCSVTLYDISQQALRDARSTLETTLAVMEEHGMADRALLNRISFTNALEERNYDLVIEAVTEDVEVKKSVFQQLEAIAGHDTPICTNTSLMRVDELSSFISVKSRFLGLHWMNPPYVMPLVEIIKTEHTDEDIVRSLKGFLQEKLGKIVVVCLNQSMVNRFSAAVLAEASRIMEDSRVDFQDIDTVWRHHLGVLYTLFGPFGNLDYIGLDTVLLASRYLHQLHGDERLKPPGWLIEKVERGELGIKTSKGVYQYSKPFQELLMERFVRIRKFLQLLKEISDLEG